MKKLPNISVIITTYNAKKYIIDALHSLIQQSFKDFEVIVVDDGSRDETVALVQSLAEKDFRIKCFPLEHRGRASALNFGLKQATAAWCAILDADDLWHPKKLEMQWHVICQNSSITFLATAAKNFHNNKMVVTANLPDQKLRVHRVEKNELLFRNPLSHSSVLFNKHAVSYNERQTSQIDYELWLRLSMVGRALYILEANLTFHRLHADQSFEEKHHLKYRYKSFMLQVMYAVKFRKIYYIVPQMAGFIVGYMSSQVRRLFIMAK